MAAPTSDEIREAVQKVEDVSKTLHHHIGAQVEINNSLKKSVEKNSEAITALQLENRDSAGTMNMVRADLARVLEIVSNGQSRTLAWINALTPWALVLCGLVYFFITNKGGN